MRRIASSGFAILLVGVLVQPTFACAGLYSWFQTVFGLEYPFIFPTGLTLPSTLEELPGHVVLGTEVVDNFRGCDDGKIIQFRSGLHVVCDDYGYKYVGYGTEVVLLARPSISGSSNHGCRFNCKMIITDYLAGKVYDVLCDDYMEELYGRTPSGNVIAPTVTTPSVDTGLDEELRRAQEELDQALRELEEELAPTPVADRTDMGEWNWLWDIPGGPPQHWLDYIDELVADCKVAAAAGWPNTYYYYVRPDMCDDLGDLYP